MSITTTPQSSRSFWPYAIVLVFVLFGSYIGYMVSQAMRTTVDLVSPDYYQQELRHQQRMDAVARTAALPAPVELAYKAAQHQLTLQLPVELAQGAPQGQLHFFRPSDQLLDFTLPLTLNAAGTQQLSTAQLRPGFWRVRLELQAANQAYFLEKDLLIK
ncbi:FixH family protein [Hymenobacter wooponensis]|uniref:Nitrogen fixation protein FixH n=1 Tax=Hymenobacter wooponensis TaxID=1525360 RepID=A0A4Z0MJS7_9BACT|nr:FixH family protein [Hymenobacter wooponensis]TGD79771.1 nitrogen fixation protein FixH [Hymenobacter wooponensis]